jgi:hypothetical protein
VLENYVQFTASVKVFIKAKILILIYILNIIDVEEKKYPSSAAATKNAMQ